MAPRGRPQILSDEALLEAAKRVFLEEGVGATTAAIARRAGISESVIFHRYKTKEGLFIAVLDQQMRVAPALEALASKVGQGDIAETLFDLAMGIVEASKALMPFMTLAATMARASNWKLDQLRQRISRPQPVHVRSLELLEDFFDREAKARRLRAVDPALLARVFWGAVIQHIMEKVWWGLQEALPVSTPAYLRGLIDLLLSGAARSPSRR